METLREYSPEWVADCLKSSPTKEIRVPKINLDTIVGYLSDYEQDLKFKIRFEGSEAVLRNDLSGDSIDGLANQLNQLEEHLTKANHAYDLVIADRDYFKARVNSLTDELATAISLLGEKAA